ncbi:MAG TPA: hypothetical protein VFU41_05465 [Gemmatimonadales bacterium]|nr:hypothetical protein [Gemmatimonadales bacterium]
MLKAPSPTTVTERLSLILDWYQGMISERTGRLVYTYDPEADVTIADGSPIRDIASIWDVELLSRFLARSDLLPLVERSLEHYSGYLVGRDGALVLDPVRLGEPSGIAHGAFMILAFLESRLAGREAKIVGWPWHGCFGPSVSKIARLASGAALATRSST